VGRSFAVGSLSQRGRKTSAGDNSWPEYLGNESMMALGNSHPGSGKSVENKVSDLLTPKGGQNRIRTQDIGGRDRLHCSKSIRGNLERLAFINNDRSTVHQSERKGRSLTVVQRLISGPSDKAGEDELSVIIERNEFEKSFVNQCARQSCVVPPLKRNACAQSEMDSAVLEQGELLSHILRGGAGIGKYQGMSFMSG